MLALLESDISEDIDLSSIEDRKRLEEFGARFDTALDWHAKQLADEKLRLKALASRFFLPPEDLTLSAACPLCAQHLKTEDQRALAKELGDLRASAGAAERVIDDACSDLEKALRTLLPQNILDHFVELALMNPAVDYGIAVRARFVTSPPFSNVLVGLARSVEEQVAAQEESFPCFQYPKFDTSATSEPVTVSELRRFIHDVRRVIALGVWWGTHSVRRYLVNRPKIPATHFSMLDQMTLKLLAALEDQRYILPGRLMPDIALAGC